MCAFTGSQKILWPLCSSTWASNSMWRVRPILEGASSTMPTPGIPTHSCPTSTSLSILRITATTMLSAWASISRYLSQMSFNPNIVSIICRPMLLFHPSDQDISKPDCHNWYLWDKSDLVCSSLFLEIKCFLYCASFEQLQCRSANYSLGKLIFNKLKSSVGKQMAFDISESSTSSESIASSESSKSSESS